jgi:hypothetical protein
MKRTRLALLYLGMFVWVVVSACSIVGCGTSVEKPRGTVGRIDIVKAVGDSGVVVGDSLSLNESGGRAGEKLILVALVGIVVSWIVVWYLFRGVGQEGQ